ncbi:MAG: IS1634 family transposase, partial [Pseudonocardia sp.]
MAWVRKVRTASGATAVQIAESVAGRRRIVRHVGSARGEAELGLLIEEAHRLLADDQQGMLDLGITPAAPKVTMVAVSTQAGLFPDAGAASSLRQLVPRPRVLKTSSMLLYEALAGVYAGLGFDVVSDEVFRDLVIARVVEPTSLLDVDRVLAEMGRVSASLSTRKRTLRRAHAGTYRDQIAKACFNHTLTHGDVSLVLYDVTTLYFEAEKEDELRKVGYSKERRVDPQIVVGLLVDRRGFPLEIGCFEGNKAETLTLIPIVKQFQSRHGLADIVIVADAGMLSATNLRDLDEADLRFIVGSRVTKAPNDLESHFRWHGDAFTDAQVIDTITPRDQRGTAVKTSDPKRRAEPVWDPAVHAKSWRAVWAYSRKRAVRDNTTLTLQENKARAVVAGGEGRQDATVRQDPQRRQRTRRDRTGQGTRTRGVEGLRHQHRS